MPNEGKPLQMIDVRFLPGQSTYVGHSGGGGSGNSQHAQTIYAGDMGDVTLVSARGGGGCVAPPLTIGQAIVRAHDAAQASLPTGMNAVTIIFDKDGNYQLRAAALAPEELIRLLHLSILEAQKRVRSR